MAEGRDDLNHELMLLELQDIRTPRMIEVLPQTEGRDNRAFDPSTQRLHTGRGQGQDTQPMSVINAGNEEPSTVPKIKTTELMIVRPKTTRKICKPIKEQSEISEADAKRADNARRTNDIGVRLVEDESEDNNNGNSSKKYALMNHFLNAAGYSDPEKIDLTGNDKDMILDFPVDVYRKKRKRTIIAVISVFGALICIGAIQVTILAALGHIKIRPDNSTKIIIEPPKTGG
ncbi:uncharacterized protein LOC141898338 [Tubulanus polymorphus]|uniref:uncharacterized protein LOC141898338 n=1 Tax=Tubulanus polymorphus TaxID=672921 RepID=UPI003DA6A05A